MKKYKFLMQKSEMTARRCWRYLWCGGCLYFFLSGVSDNIKGRRVL